MFIGWSYTRFVFLALIGNPTWLPGPIMCSDWSKFKKSSCQKPLSQLNCDFAGMIIGWSCTKFVNRLPIGNSRWPPSTQFNIGPYGNFTFSSFFLKPQNRFEPNLTEMFIGWSYTRFVFLVLIGNPTWLPGPIMCSDWSKFKKSSCQKPLSQLNCNFAGMIIGWSCTKFVNRLPIGNSRWPPSTQFNIGPYGNFTFSSFFLKPQNRFEPNLTEMFIGWSYTRFVFLVLIGNPTWLPGPIMCSDWSKFKKSSCQKPLSQLNCDFAGMIIGWSCTKFVNRLPIGNSRWPPSTQFNIGPYGNFTFSSFFLKPQNRFESNLAEMFIGWSYTRFLFLALIGNPTWLPGPIMCSDWSKFKKSSCQKPLSQLNCDFAGMIIGWSCTKFVNRLPIGNSRWPPSTQFNIGPYGNFTFSSFFLKPQNRFEPNLTEMFIGWSYTRFVFLVLIGNPTQLPGPIMCSDWSKFKKSSCQKPLSQLNCDFAGMIIGWSCTKFVNRLPIGNSRWPPSTQFNIGPYGNFTFSSFFLKPQNRFEPNLTEMFIGWSYTRFVFLVLIGNPTWLPGPIMCSDWSKFKKSSCQKPLSQLNCDFAGMIIGWSCTKFVNRLPIGNSRWPPSTQFNIGPYGNFTFSSFFLKPQNRFEPNLTGMFIGWSYTRFVFLVLIGNPTWLPGPIMCSDWSKF